MLKKLSIIASLLSASALSYANTDNTQSTDSNKSLRYSYEVFSKNDPAKVSVTKGSILSEALYVPGKVQSTPSCEITEEASMLNVSVAVTGESQFKDAHNFLVILNPYKLKEGDDTTFHNMKYTDDLCPVFNQYKNATVWLLGLSLKVGEQKSIKLPDGNEFYIKLISFNK